MLTFGFNATVLFPLFTSPIKAVPQKYSIKVSVNISRTGIVHCSAFKPGSKVLSTVDIAVNGYSSYRSGAGQLFVNILNLNPSTNYSIYCYSNDLYSHSMPYSLSQQFRIFSQTL
jgi:hypothetical protein